MFSSNRLKKRRRRGFTLVLFVLFLMCCMAMAAVVIDIGFVRLSKRQMQSLTDAAALGIQRELDDPQLQPFVMSDVMSEAGPTLDFEDDGMLLSGEFRAHPKLGSNSTGRWIPTLQAPQGNPADDILIGAYQSEKKQHGEVSVDPTSPDYYRREDFDMDATESNSDVLVRLRRTGEQLAPGGSSGPPTPFFFGRGLVIGGSPDVWQRIERGTFVRQTSIAQRTPAMSVGPYIAPTEGDGPGPGIVGLINVQVSLADWQSPGDQLDATQFEIYDPGELSFTSIGDPAKESSETEIISTQPEDYPDNSGYVTIIADDLTTFDDKVVIGFGYVVVDQDEQVLTRQSRRGYRNTSATPRPLRNLSGEQWEDLLAANAQLFSSSDSVVSAPVLVRSED
ncbi:pilus assembly protein TadG-related protein [Lignipirellula cremea]|uniref:Putative Flp pilus-assembly TadG-like N-terminal domain-containing protein n=1 Tax=Lignipirellula cremea TaxID=2528010 RepID=A0A518E425_9BACT|nr:Tad domain-containing protein [Lignipirellula cremea]QDU98840.1 hypothetical protein Pla8534_67510 [Lignipirellula cremea]